MINFYRRFLPGVARTLQPLTTALAGKTVNNFSYGPTTNRSSPPCTESHHHGQVADRGNLPSSPSTPPTYSMHQVNPMSSPTHSPAPPPGSAAICAAITDHNPLNLRDMALRQILCPQVQFLRNHPGLLIVTQQVGDLSLLGNAFTGTFQPLVPLELCRQVFDHLHRAAYPGMRAKRRLIASRYIWPKLATQVTAWARECLHCQRAKIHRHIQVRPEHIPIPTRRFSHIHMDLVVPLPESQGFTYLFPVVDRTSRWPEAILIKTVTTNDCTSALFQGWVSRFSVPAVITLEHSAQFTSSLWAA